MQQLSARELACGSNHDRDMSVSGALVEDGQVSLLTLRITTVFTNFTIKFMLQVVILFKAFFDEKYAKIY